MKRPCPFIKLCCTFAILALYLAPPVYALEPIAKRRPATATLPEPPKPAFFNESEFGYVLISGNADSETFNLQQSNGFEWSSSRVAAKVSLLRTAASGNVTANSYAGTVRYDKDVLPRIGVFAGLRVEGNRFAGFDPRYGSDVGTQWMVLETTSWKVLTELGYRYFFERRLVGSEQMLHLGRFFAQIEGHVRENVTARIAGEYLPNFYELRDWMANAEMSIIVQLGGPFSLKWSYLLAYRAVPLPPNNRSTDSQITTSVIAKF